MESVTQIKNRIDGIVGTRQITQSMRLVSSARLVGVRGRMENNRDFLSETMRMAREAASETDCRGHKYVRESDPSKKSCVIVVGAERGLCGGYNINVCREARALLREQNGAALITVGLKAKVFFKRRARSVGNIEKAYLSVTEKPFFEDAEEIARCVLGLYERGDVDSIYLVHTHFVNMLSLAPMRNKLLPFSLANRRVYDNGNEKDKDKADIGGPKALTRYEPCGPEFLESAVPFYLAAAIFGALLEASVCEQCSRITSMDAAVRNSDDMVEQLTLQYNKARQGEITSELADIIGGTTALKRKTAR